MDCKLCGKKDINPSFGGPDICGQCDCGSVTAGHVMMLSYHNGKLLEEITAKDAEIAALRLALEEKDRGLSVFGAHKIGCKIIKDITSKCTCGLQRIFSIQPSPSAAGKIVEDSQLLEKLSDLEHDRWSRWHEYAVKNWTPENVARWNKLAQTPYTELSEQSKESDRKEARNTLRLLREPMVEKNEI